MTETVVPGPGPVESLLQMSAGAVLPRCLHAVANLGVADALDEAPQSAAALAAATGANADALGRALRLLSTNGVFAHRDGLFAHSPASRLLRADHPRSMRQLVRMFGLQAFWSIAGDIEYSVRTGQPAADKVLPGGLWSYLTSDADAGRVFDEAMTAKAHGQVAGVIAAYDFGRFRTIADVGGGRGHLLAAVLASAPDATGVLIDQPHVLDAAAAVASDRLRLQAADFFSDDLPACDGYLLMEIIHDWDDERARAILSRVHAAAPPGATVLVIEAIMPELGEPSWPGTLDLWMLTISGRQRTYQEYADLLADAGFVRTRRIDTDGGASIIEGTRA